MTCSSLLFIVFSSFNVMKSKIQIAKQVCVLVILNLLILFVNFNTSLIKVRIKNPREYPNDSDILGYTVQNGFNRNESCQIQPMPSRPAKEPNRGGNGDMAPPRFQKDPTGSFKGLTTRDHLIFGNKRECCGSYPKELSLSSTWTWSKFNTVLQPSGEQSGPLWTMV